MLSYKESKLPPGKRHCLKLPIGSDNGFVEGELNVFESQRT